MAAGEFFAGYITEYSLSVDNLFVFVLIMAAFRVPAVHQHRVLLVGIVIALVMRGAFIAVGAAAIQAFSWVFYLFAAVLIVTAVNVARQGTDHDEEFSENALLRLMRRVLPVTPEFHGSRSFVRVAGRRMVTPMLVVMVAIGSTDLLFALDSIPAIFGLTQEPYLVFTANAFALMGLRQLYFLLGGLLSKLVYLSYGLAVILGFIGVKLVLEALHENNLPFINDGQPVPVPTVGIVPSLCVIIGVLAITTVASLVKVRRDAAAPQAAARDPEVAAAADLPVPTPTRGAHARCAPGQPGPVAGLSGIRAPSDAPQARGGRWCSVTAASAPSPTSAVIQVKVGCRLRSVGEPGLSSRSVVPSGRVAVVSHGMWLCPNTRTSTSGNAAAHRRSRPAAAPVSWTTANRTPPRSIRATSGSRARSAGPSLFPWTPHQPCGPRLQGVEQVDGDPVARVHDHVGGVDRRPQRLPAGRGHGAAGGCPRSGRAAGTPLCPVSSRPSRSTTNTSVSPGLITPPAPRSP